jgi:endonuclease YncB( thermonuclease family)
MAGASPARRGGRRIRFLAPLLFAALQSNHPSFADEFACQPRRIDERVRVKHVVDGDTLVLTDGRKLRLIGIDTPEIGRGGFNDEPYARPARSALQALVQSPGRVVGLSYDRERTDHYGRTLAHLFLTNGDNVTARLLAQGVGPQLVIPPNHDYLGCYLAAEREAFRKQRGIWTLPEFQPLNPLQLAGDIAGRRVIQGRVTRVIERKGGIYLELGPSVVIRIARTDLRYFDQPTLTQLRGQQVLARGRLYRGHGKLRLRVRHPAYLWRAPY